MHKGNILTQCGQQIFQPAPLHVEVDQNKERIALILTNHGSQVLIYPFVAARISFLLGAAAHLEDNGSALRMTQEMIQVRFIIAFFLYVVNPVDALPCKALVGVESTYEQARHCHCSV